MSDEATIYEFRESERAMVERARPEPGLEPGQRRDPASGRIFYSAAWIDDDRDTLDREETGVADPAARRVILAQRAAMERLAPDGNIGPSGRFAPGARERRQQTRDLAVTALRSTARAIERTLDQGGFSPAAERTLARLLETLDWAAEILVPSDPDRLES